MNHILCIEDDHEIGEWITSDLQKRGYHVTWLTSGIQALQHMEGIELVILDVMLPGLDGFTVGQRIKAQYPSVPILMLSALTSVEDKLAGLAFADDYLTKPFHPDELAARIEVLSRRGNTHPQNTVVELQHLRINLSENSIVDRETEEEILLTAKEHQLLHFFLKHPNQILTKEQIYEGVWGEDYLGADNTLMVHIRYLREKLERDPSKPTIIQTIRGLGYRVKR